MVAMGSLEICKNCMWYDEKNDPSCNAPSDFVGMPSVEGGCEHYAPMLYA
jgi:hypothetical protein